MSDPETTHEITTTLNAGTMMIIAEILRMERGLEKCPLHDVKRVVAIAIKNLGAKEVH